MKKNVLSINTGRQEVFANGKRFHLTPKEFKVLVALRDEPNRFTVTREKLLEDIWGIEKSSKVDTRTVDQHIARLRRKLNDVGLRRVIETSTGCGYKYSGF